MSEPLVPDCDPDINVLTAPDRDTRMWAVVAHISPLLGHLVPPLFGSLIPYGGNMILPLLIWLLKREKSPFIDDQGKEAVNFQITVTILMVISIILLTVCTRFNLMIVVAIGAIVLMIVVGIGALVLMILAAIQANNGVAYRYPYILRLIK